MLRNLPTWLTWSRIAMIPLMVVLFYGLPDPWGGIAAALIFAVAGLTDWLDGYLARRLEVTSRFGAFLDPVADKLIVAAALVLVVHDDATLGIAVAAIVIIGREIAISALREWMSAIGSRARVAVSWIGKVKTTAQMVSIFLLLWAVPLGPVPVYLLGEWLLYLAAVLTLISMAQYMLAARRGA
ncbi:CDP-diacylglycerol--glycerol-3-phosphate 3-phosphatidyltransferase [Thioalkalivibrio nitratireducens DSM 14787]|uniref:CDP-diacylglycerol--glycerol-3-phosphate 3-phosphatidyltransferase n=1 Tax=Thioalkalivibrio nitratireducens (strain DSM 14787 / UNIQEM 213 / ALEN2) TaxID=1255043 RepID=L0DVP1_THIND|nr:CDP-diacylglycerol--glycerol-3-phosphate 3-phosphatidyltransferase [Thioalkalivibrio nitratireducens]AGA33050.1 CDP-diacylglycerol--glycerol-3-phosphate 3-phosphatidyltransferase [Thioalkalivibrio nitratireducens DSM 14787]